MRQAFVQTLIELAKQDQNIELITGDLGYGVLKPFWEQLPDQFINAGISEQNIMAMAAGMAREGKTIFVYSIGNFPTLRCLEQIRNACAYHEANVKIICVGGGLTYGALGMSHHATEELGVLRTIPNLTVFAPADAAEAVAVTKAMASEPGTCYMRLGRGGEMQIHSGPVDFAIGKAIPVQEGQNIAVFSTGDLCGEAKKACELLTEKGYHPALLSFPTVKPIDEECIRRCAMKYSLIVTCEEHNRIGGLGGAVAEVLSEMKDRKAQLLRIGLNDCYVSIVGDQTYLREAYGLSAAQIARKIEEAYE